MDYLKIGTGIELISILVRKLSTNCGRKSIKNNLRMLLIYSAETSYRLQYICKFIFQEQLGLSYTLTLDEENFNVHDGPKINYSSRKFSGDAYSVGCHPLLFEKGVTSQTIECFETSGYKAFFKTNDADFDFDILAASFYLLSRYEEYLPHTSDSYGRYEHTNSLAFREGFLNIPLVNYWIKSFEGSLKNFFPSLNPALPYFSYLPTYDIDIAWSFKNKSILRNIGGFLKRPSIERVKVLLNAQADPFDSYEFLHALHLKYRLHPVYFFLLATSGNKYDKNLSPYSTAMGELLRQHSDKYDAGIHPSWGSYERPALIAKEKKILEAASGKPVRKSRQHYIKFALPVTFQNLVKAGIDHDYSMGYGSINGFRASVGSAHFWYDLSAEKVTNLRLHPFCFMDANCFYEQKQNIAEAREELQHYFDVCKKSGAVLITIFHNQFLGTGRAFKGWRELYEEFIAQLPR
jgi:hypothetical protein